MWAVDLGVSKALGLSEILQFQDFSGHILCIPSECASYWLRSPVPRHVLTSPSLHLGFLESYSCPPSIRPAPEAQMEKEMEPPPVLLPGKSHGRRSLVGCSAQTRVAKTQTWLSNFTFTFHFHALEKEMATHSSVLAWRIPGTGEPSGLPSVGSHRVGHNWSDLAAAAALY